MSAVGASGEASGKTTGRDNVVGLDKNSLVSIGRVSGHGVRIRIGAENSGSGKLTLVPRTYNVSLVVLTLWDKDPAKRVTSLEAITHSTLVSTEDGSPLTSGPNRTRKKLAEKVGKKAKNYGYDVLVSCAAAPPAAPSNPAPSGNQPSDALSPQEEANLDLLRAVDRADYNRIVTCLKNLPMPLDAQAHIKLQRLLSELLEIQTDARFSKMWIALQKRPEPALPDGKQLAVYTDGKNNRTTFCLHGGRALAAKDLRAELQLKGSDSKLVASGIKVAEDGATVEIYFPSLEQLNISTNDLAEKPLIVAIEDARDRQYAVRAWKALEPPEEPCKGKASPDAVSRSDKKDVRAGAETK